MHACARVLCVACVVSGVLVCACMLRVCVRVGARVLRVACSFCRQSVKSKSKSNFDFYFDFDFDFDLQTL